MHAAPPENLQRFVIECKGQPDGIFEVGEVHDIIGNINAMGVGDGTDAQLFT